MTMTLRPYPAMKDSGLPWLGELPEHWHAGPLRRYCRVFAGATPSRAVPEYWDGGTIPWLASGEVNLRRIRSSSQFITDAGFAASSTKWIRPGSLVLALAGQGRTKGMVATVEFPATCNQSLAVIEPSPRVSDYSFLAYYLESRYLELRALVGDGLRDGLNLEHVRAIPTPLPPLTEQAEIVRFLDHVDRRIRRYVRAKQKLIRLLEELKQAIIHRAVTRGLDPNARLKFSGVQWLGDVPQHWEVIPTRHLFRQVTRQDVKGDEPKMSMSRRLGLVRSEELGTRAATAASSVAFSVCHQGDLVMNKYQAHNGLFGCATERGLITANYSVFSPTAKAQAAYYALLYGSQSYRSAFLVACRGVGDGMMPLYTSAFGRIPSLVPPPEEQLQIAESVGESAKSVNAAITRVERTIALVHELRSRLFADIVTGKLDTREASARLEQEGDVGSAVGDEPEDEATVEEGGEEYAEGENEELLEVAEGEG